MRQPRWVNATAIRQAVSPDRARRLLRQELADGFDPSSDPPRLAPPAGSGQLLVMPSATRRSAGVKVLSVAPGNPARGLERIQAVYVLMDAETLTPTVLLDGTALTSLRTPAVSALAADALAPERVDSVVLVGTGPQAIGHAEALLAIRRFGRVTVVGRDGRRTRDAAARVAALDPRVSVLAVATDGSGPGEQALRVEDAVRAAGIVVTATSSAHPVIEDAWVTDGTCVVAIGSHEPDRHELPASLLGRSLVVVEDVAAARREAGDVVLAVEEGTLSWDSVRTLRDLVLGRVQRADDRPNVFKSVGMAWEDLVIAEHAAAVRTPLP